MAGYDAFPPLNVWDNSTVMLQLPPLQLVRPIQPHPTGSFNADTKSHIPRYINRLFKSITQASVHEGAVRVRENQPLILLPLLGMRALHSLPPSQSMKNVAEAKLKKWALLKELMSYL